MRTVPSSGGVSLAVHDFGGSGRPTLFAHATGLHGAVWEPFAAALGDGFQRWALDFRAHGQSVVPPNQPLPWTEMGDDVEAAVHHLPGQPGQFLGIGHSMGAAALLLAEQARPGTFAGLWLFEPIAPPPSPAGAMEGGKHLSEGAARRRENFPTAAEALAHYSAKPPLNTWQAAALAAYVRHGFVADEDGTVHLACRPADEAQIFRGGDGHQAFSRLGDVHCPVLVVCGDHLLPPGALAEAIALVLPQGSLERHRFMGHFGPLEAPRTLAASAAAFASTLR